jgi:hypothetical protein
MRAVYQIIKNPQYEILKAVNSSHNFPAHIHQKLCVGRIDSGEKYLKN